MRSEAEFLERLKTLAERDMTIIVSTHRMSLLSLVDRLMIFDKGRLVADGPRDAVLAKFQAGQKSPAAPPAGRTRSADPNRRLSPPRLNQMRHSDFAFANDVRAAAELRTPRTSRMLLAATLAMLAVGLIWAHFAVLEEVTRGNGRVVPSRLTQFVQSLEGGIVNEILVQEGMIVQQGQPLMRISDVKFASELGEVRERRAATAARVARLEAEAQGRTSIAFPEGLAEISPDNVAAEISVFEVARSPIGAGPRCAAAGREAAVFDIGGPFA